MTARLTVADWKLINAALAYFEAADCAYEETGLPEALEQQKRMPALREKVWDRLPD